MKAATVLLLLFKLQVEGSFMDEFAGAMTSVENAFDKLLNDVVSDLKNTVHCTVLAVEQVLAMNGVLSEPSTYTCYPTDTVNNNNKLASNNFMPTNERDNRRIYSDKDMVKRIHSSISNVNKTLINILDNDGHERLKHVKKALNHEANRLTEVSRLLRQELEKISHRLRKQIQHNDSDRPSLESLWKDLKLLHSVEENDRNVSEVKEISKVLNEALKVFHLDTNNKVKSDDDKIKTIMRQLERESNNDSVAFSNIDEELAQLKERRSDIESYSDQTSKSFKDVALNIFRDKDNIRKEMEQSQDKVTFNDKVNSADADYYSLFGDTSKEQHKKAIDQAKNIIEDSAHTEQMLNNFFGTPQLSAVDVFNNDKLLDYGNS